MSKPKTLRIVPRSRLILADSSVVEEGVAADVPTGEAENLIALGHAVEVVKGEVEAGAKVEVLPPPVAPAPAPEPAPEPVVVQEPPRS
jgi:hypothetical protein